RGERSARRLARPLRVARADLARTAPRLASAAAEERVVSKLGVDAPPPGEPQRTKSGQFRAVAKEIHDLVERVVEKLDVNGYNPTPVMDIAALIAHADGKITDSEMKALQQVLEPILHQQVDSEPVGYLIHASVEVVRHAGVEAR